MYVKGAKDVAGKSKHIPVGFGLAILYSQEDNSVKGTYVVNGSVILRGYHVLKIVTKPVKMKEIDSMVRDFLVR